jgi:hypothetical protein
MAALAAILILFPGYAFAEVCDKGDFRGDFWGDFWANTYPPLRDWISASPLKAQLEFALSPSNWVTALVVIWMISSSGPRATIIGACWFAALGCFHALGYFLVDLGDPSYRAALSEGCVVNSPYRTIVNFAFSAAAVFLTVQRIDRRKKQNPGA